MIVQLFRTTHHLYHCQSSHYLHLSAQLLLDYERSDLLGSSRTCIKGILGEISLSSRGVKSFKTSGFSGKVILFAFAQVGRLPAFRFEWHVLHIRSVLSTLLRPVRHKVRISLEQD